MDTVDSSEWYASPRRMPAAPRSATPATPAASAPPSPVVGPDAPDASLAAALLALHADSPDGLVVFDGAWRYVYANAAAGRLGGFDPAAVVGRPLDEQTPRVWERPIGEALRAVQAGGAPRELLAVRGPNGRAYDTHVSLTPAGVAVRFRDVTARVAADEERDRSAAALRASEQRYRALVESAPDTIALHRDGRLLYVNPAGCRLLGVDGPEALVGRLVWDFLTDEGREPAAARADALNAGRPLDVASAAYTIRRPDGSVRRVEAVSTPVAVDGAPAIRTLLRDVTERRQMEARLRHQAEHDALTGLANRALFRERVEQAVARVGRRDAAGAAGAAGAAVLFVDLDDFKAVNDRFGHQTGDRLLAHVAKRLLHVTRGRDTVARLGGDEFAVLVEHVEADSDTEAVVARVLDALNRTVPLAGRPVALAASVGVARVGAGDTADEVLRNADLAMYRAKGAGKRRAAAYEPGMHRALADRLELAADLARAAERGELRVAYQPVVDLRSGRVVGLEALARWRHAERGVVMPAAFIPVAEETGAIREVGRRVLAAACAQLAAWDERAPARALPWLSVNVSGRQLEDDAFADEVAAVLRDTGVAPGRLTLEIAESTLMRRTAETAAGVGALKALGVKLGVDDFGTGYSSLAQLQRLRVDVLKLDRSFVHGVAADAGSGEIARAVLALGGALRLRTVAEGIETPAQYARLLALGCAYGQGYLFAPPLDAAEVVELLWGADPLPVWAADADDAG